ncbi:MAG: SDR family oxidoreductase [Acidobacteriota bacterium]
MDISGRTALVTGSNRGIGRAFAEALRDAGARRVYCAARRPESVEELVATAPDQLVPVTLDITDDAQIAAAVEQAGDVDLLINNAGVARGGSLIKAKSLDGARDDMNTNYFGTLAMIRAFAPVLAAHDGGSIVNVLSISSLVSFPTIGAYSASKAAGHSLTQGVRADLAGQGTQVIGVYPGPIDTDMAEDLEMPKAPPSAVAEATLAALADGTEEVFPDAMAAQISSGVQQNSRATAKRVASMAPS